MAHFIRCVSNLSATAPLPGVPPECASFEPLYIVEDPRFIGEDLSSMGPDGTPYEYWEIGITGTTSIRHQGPLAEAMEEAAWAWLEGIEEWAEAVCREPQASYSSHNGQPHPQDRGDGRDKKGRFVPGSHAARACVYGVRKSGESERAGRDQGARSSRSGATAIQRNAERGLRSRLQPFRIPIVTRTHCFWKAIESIQARYPAAIDQHGNHISLHFLTNKLGTQNGEGEKEGADAPAGQVEEPRPGYNGHRQRPGSKKGNHHIILGAYRWIQHAHLAGCRFDVEAKAAEAVAFSVLHGGRSFALPSKLEGTRDTQQILAELSHLPGRGRFEPLTLFAPERKEGKEAVLSLWRGRRSRFSLSGQLVGRARHKHVSWLMPLLPTGLVRCHVLSVTGGTKGKAWLGCNVVYSRRSRFSLSGWSGCCH